MSDKDLRDLLCIRLRATAALQLQMAAALIGKGQDELRKHFMDSAELLQQANKDLSKMNLARHARLLKAVANPADPFAEYHRNHVDPIIGGIGERRSRAIDAEVANRLAYEAKWARWNDDFDRNLAAVNASLDRTGKHLEQMERDRNDPELSLKAQWDRQRLDDVRNVRETSRG